MRSPKSKFMAVINFDKATAELGNKVTFTHNNIASLTAFASSQIGKQPADVVLYENKASYPELDWVPVARYSKNK